MLPLQFQRLKGKKRINHVEREHIEKYEYYWNSKPNIHSTSCLQRFANKLSQLLHDLNKCMRCVICILLTSFIFFILYLTNGIHISNFKLTDSMRTNNTKDDTHPLRLCLYDTNQTLNILKDSNIGDHGTWTNLKNANCRNENKSYCKGDLSTMYDFNINKYSIFQYTNDCIYHIYNPLGDDLLQCLDKKPILFLGDSTLQYMVYYTLLELLLNVSLFNADQAIAREFEFSDDHFVQRYNISIYFRYTSGWPSIRNHHGTKAFKDKRLMRYLDKRFFAFGNITHVVFHSLFHDITNRMMFEKSQSLEQHVAGYKEDLIKIYIGLLQRIEFRAKENEHLRDDDFMLYIWPSTHVGNSGNLTNMFFLQGNGYFEWFNDWYEYYLHAMVEAIVSVVERELRFKDHIVFIDTSSMSKGHRNYHYGDGLHYGSGEYKDGIKRSPVVRNMMTQAVLNEICLRT